MIFWIKMPPLEACPTTPSPLRDGVIMSLRGTLAEAGGPKQSHKAFKTTRLPRALRGVYPEVLEGLAMTKTDWDTASDIHTSSPGLSPLRGVGSPSRRPRGGEEFWVVRQPALAYLVHNEVMELQRLRIEPPTKQHCFQEKSFPSRQRYSS